MTLEHDVSKRIRQVEPKMMFSLSEKQIRNSEMRLGITYDSDCG